MLEVAIRIGRRWRIVPALTSTAIRGSRSVVGSRTVGRGSVLTLIATTTKDAIQDEEDYGQRESGEENMSDEVR